MKPRSIDDRHIPEILRRLSDDETFRAIAEWYRQEYHVPVSPETVRRAALRAGYQPRYAGCPDLEALGVPRRRYMDPPARRLRTLARRNQGKDLNADDAERLDSWLAKLDRENLVVTWVARDEYDADGNLTESKGWDYVERQPGDVGYIHVPASAPAA